MTDPARTERKRLIRNLDSPDPDERAEAGRALDWWVQTGEWPDMEGEAA